MNIVTDFLKKNDKLIIFEVTIIVLYITLLFGELTEWFVSEKYGIFSEIMFWTLSTGVDSIILSYPIILFLIPVIGLIIYRMKYLVINITCSFVLFIHIILYFYILIKSFSVL